MPIKIDFEVNGKLVRDENIRPRVEAVLRQVTIETVQLLKIEKTVPVDQSLLKGSFVAKVDAKNLVGIAGSPLGHGDVQDKGRRAGKRFPPKKEIEAWILRKGILKNRAKDLISQAKKDGKALPKGFTAGVFAGKGRGALAGKIRKLRRNKKTRDAARLATSELDSMAFVIRRSIAKEGIAGKHFYRTVARKMRPRFKKLAAEAIAG